MNRSEAQAMAIKMGLDAIERDGKYLVGTFRNLGFEVRGEGQTYERAFERAFPRVMFPWMTEQPY